MAIVFTGLSRRANSTQDQVGRGSLFSWHATGNMECSDLPFCGLWVGAVLDNGSLGTLFFGNRKISCQKANKKLSESK